MMPKMIVPKIAMVPGVVMQLKMSAESVVVIIQVVQIALVPLMVTLLI